MKLLNNCINCNKETTNKKYCSQKCRNEYTKNKIIKDPHKSTNNTLKNILIDKYGNICQECNNSIWNNKPIHLELEHIDGNNKNHNWENLKLLCPNCHSQTKTYCLNKKYR